MTLQLRSPGPPDYEAIASWVDGRLLADVETVLERLRAGRSVLIHPVREDELESHTSLAKWLGAPLALRLDQL